MKKTTKAPASGKPRKTFRDDQRHFDAQEAAAARQGKRWSAWARQALRLAGGTAKKERIP